MERIETRKKENPKLCQRLMSDGRVCLYLEYYLGREEEFVYDSRGNKVCYTSGKMKGKPKRRVHHQRKKESLNLYLVANPKKYGEKQGNKRVLALALAIREKKEMEFKHGDYHYGGGKLDFFAYCDEFLETYQRSKATRNLIVHAIKDFRTFLATDSVFRFIGKTLPFERLTPSMMERFARWMEQKHNGGGCKTYYGMFNTVLNKAVREELIAKNPCVGIRVRGGEDVLVKDILTEEEISRLIATPYDERHNHIKRAFLFSLFTGLRFCDVNDLRFKNIDFTSHRLRLFQKKVYGLSSSSSVVVPLSDSVMSLLGRRGKPEEKVFNLPHRVTCVRHVDAWVRKANIEKHITWHCARHSFAVNVLTNGANIMVVRSLLGHTTLRCTEKYMRVVDKQKEEAINSLITFDYGR